MKITANADTVGVIDGVQHEHRGTTYRVRYFINGKLEVEWFYDHELAKA